MKINNKIRVAIICLMTNTLWVPQSICQFSGRNPAFGNKKPPKHPVAYEPSTVTKPVDIPGVPKYPGKAKFEFGNVYDKDPNGTRYVMHYQAKENALTVYKWYKDNLVPPTWTIKSINNGLITAVDPSGANLTVHVKQYGSGTRINIYYSPASKYKGK